MVMEFHLTKSWTLPFFPMRARHGHRITRARIKKLLNEMEDPRYLWQPLLAGDRVLLAVRNGSVVAYNGYYGTYHSIVNENDFFKFSDGTLFDGIVQDGTFYPFECLSLDGRSLKANTAEERVLIAFQMCRLMKLPWKFSKPTRRWLSNLKNNLPEFTGIIRKQANLPYFEQTSSIAQSQGWMRFKW